MEEEFPPLSITPCVSPASNAGKVVDAEKSMILSQLLSLTKLINSRLETLEKMVSSNPIVIPEMKKDVQENTEHITVVKESFDAIYTEINAKKGGFNNVETQLKKYTVGQKST